MPRRPALVTTESAGPQPPAPRLQFQPYRQAPRTSRKGLQVWVDPSFHMAFTLARTQLNMDAQQALDQAIQLWFHHYGVRPPPR